MRAVIHFLKVEYEGPSQEPSGEKAVAIDYVTAISQPEKGALAGVVTVMERDVPREFRHVTKIEVWA